MIRVYKSKPVGKSPKSNSEAVSKSMQSNKKSGTKPEMILSKLLNKKIAKTRLPGNPDFTFPGKKIAIFVHGCFWHRCPKCRLPMPKTNSDFWRRKFARNMERDRLNKKELKRMGWKVLELWEHDVVKNAEKAIDAIDNYVKRI